MSNIYAHPTMTSSTDHIWALQQRLGLRAVIEGHRVRMVGPAPLADRPLCNSSPATRAGRPYISLVRGQP